MTTREHINDYFNGRPFMVLCALALMAATAVALSMGVQPAHADSTGLFFPLKGRLIEHGPLSAFINVACLLATGGIMLALNKVFSYVRAVTHLFVSAFFLLQVANPAALVSFNAGTLMALVTALATMPLFASYQDRHSQRSIFLIFTLVATGSMFHYGFLSSSAWSPRSGLYWDWASSILLISSCPTSTASGRSPANPGPILCSCWLSSPPCWASCWP